MSTTQQLYELLKTHTRDTETLALFLEFSGDAEAARKERLAHLQELTEHGAYGNALGYAGEFNLLSMAERAEIARKLAEKELADKRPWEALRLARQYNLPEITQQAALQRSEDILSHPGCDVGPALEIARQERASDEDYRQRAVRHAYSHYIQTGNFSSLENLVSEFRSYFTELEIELAERLQKADQERLEKLNQLAAAQRGK